MKFNVFLLILTTLIAGVLPLVLPRYRIQLAHTQLYWKETFDGSIRLSHFGTCWEIIPYNKGSYIRAKSGRAVQFNGVGKRISATHDGEVGLNHRWLFDPSGQKHNVIIVPSQEIDTYVNKYLEPVHAIKRPVTRWNLILCH